MQQHFLAAHGNIGLLWNGVSRRFELAWVALLVSCLTFVAGCGEAVERDLTPGQPTLHDVVEWEPALILQEVGDTLVAIPNLRSDPLGGWLYWDGMVPQVRRYDENGALVVAMGRAGGGPGEFSQVVAFMRTAAGALVSVDQRGRVATWDDSGELLYDFSVDFAPVAGAVPIEDGILVFSSFGVASYPEAPGWMHLVDMESRSVVEVHPSPELGAEYAAATMTLGGPQARPFGESLYTAFSVVDTVWSWRSRALGNGPEPMAVPSERVRENRLPPPTSPDFAPFRSWFEESWFLRDFVRLPDGRWLYQTWTPRRGEPKGQLLLTNAEGELLWEVDGNLRILDVDDEGRVYLWDGDGSDPAEILVARVK